MRNFLFDRGYDRSIRFAQRRHDFDGDASQQKPANPKPKPEPKPIEAPKAIDPTPYQWYAIRVMHGQERRVADEITQTSTFARLAYAPLATKWVLWSPTRSGTRKKIKRQSPVFARYVFLGLTQGEAPAKRLHDKIEAVLSDSRGALMIPRNAIAQINAQDLAGHWDDTKRWREKIPFQKGKAVRIGEGPLLGFDATVDAVESEDRIRVLVNLFGRLAPVHMAACQLETV
jgi:transcription antitermination factor NusG